MYAKEEWIKVDDNGVQYYSIPSQNDMIVEECILKGRLKLTDEKIELSLNQELFEEWINKLITDGKNEKLCEKYWKKHLKERFLGKKWDNKKL